MNDLELMHYGVKGMKWGVRRYQNPDGTLTNAGKKRLAKDIKRTVERSDNGTYASKEKGYKQVGEMDAVKQASQQLKDARKKREKAFELETEFESLPEQDRDVYVQKAAKKSSERWGMDYENTLWGYRYGDADQGEDNSFNEFLRAKNVDPFEHFKSVADADHEYRTIRRQVASQLVENYGSMPVNKFETMYRRDKGTFKKTKHRYTSTVNQAIESALERLDDEEFYRKTGAYVHY